MFFKRTLSVLFATLCSLSTHAHEPIRLWNESELVEHYDVLVRKLSTGEQIELDPGRIITIKKFLGAGETTLVFDIGEGKAIRLARGSGTSAQGVYYPGYLDWFDEGFKKVSVTETPIVKEFIEESAPGRFLIVENPTVYFTLEDLLYPHPDKIIDPLVAVEAKRALVEDFAPQTWELSYVSDMYSSQLFYTARGWIIGDLTNEVYYAKNSSSSTLFTSMGTLPLEWRIKLNQAVKQAREGKVKSASFASHAWQSALKCNRLLGGLLTSLPEFR